MHPKVIDIKCYKQKGEGLKKFPWAECQLFVLAGPFGYVRLHKRFIYLFYLAYCLLYLCIYDFDTFLHRPSSWVVEFEYSQEKSGPKQLQTFSFDCFVAKLIVPNLRVQATSALTLWENVRPILFRPQISHL